MTPESPKEERPPAPTVPTEVDAPPTATSSRSAGWPARLQSGLAQGVMLFLILTSSLVVMVQATSDQETKGNTRASESNTVTRVPLPGRIWRP